MDAHSSSHPELLQALVASLYRMAWLVEARDPYTGGHLWRVSQFSRLLAEDLGLPSDEVARITLGGFLHDLGKIGVPDAILNKRDKLDDTEYLVIKTHPDIGARLLVGHPLAELVTAAVAMHHETPDGKGYPSGLEGEAIPLEARIVGLTDAFDAMTSTRPYRQGMAIPKALDIVATEAGKQFDAQLSKRLLRLGATGALDHIVGHTDRGIPLQHCTSCGPTIVIQRDQRTGDLAYCRSCGAETRIQVDSAGQIHLSGTGKAGTPRQLEAMVDDRLLDELSYAAAKHLRRHAAPQLQPRPWWQRWMST